MATEKFVTYKGEDKGFQDQLGWRWQETCILPNTPQLHPSLVTLIKSC